MYDDLSNYPQLSMKEENSVWFRIEFPENGTSTISINNQSTNNKLEFTLFSNAECNDISSGKGTPILVKLIQNEVFKYSFYDHKEGDSYYLVVNTHKSVKDISIDFLQELDMAPINTSSAIRLLDRRNDTTQDYLLIMIRDDQTGAPVNGQIVIRELNRLNALYNATDLIFPKERTLSFNISVDSYGYFPFDQELKLIGKGTDTLLVKMTAVEKGKQVELEGIEFFPQSNKLLPISEEKLKRLRDFLIFNTDIRIEIQGHVHHIGKNNFTSKRLSKRRAKSVVHFLTKNGVDKKRLVPVGYGNTEMKFPTPASASQESANRRVEVRIL